MTIYRCHAPRWMARSKFLVSWAVDNSSHPLSDTSLSMPRYTIYTILSCLVIRRYGTRERNWNEICVQFQQSCNKAQVLWRYLYTTVFWATPAHYIVALPDELCVSEDFCFMPHYFNSPRVFSIENTDPQITAGCLAVSTICSRIYGVGVHGSGESLVQLY